MHCCLPYGFLNPEERNSYWAVSLWFLMQNYKNKLDVFFWNDHVFLIICKYAHQDKMAKKLQIAVSRAVTKKNIIFAFIKYGL